MSKKKVDPFMVDDDNPEWTKEDLSKANPGRDVFEKLGIKAPRPRGRPVSNNPKAQVTVRLDTDVIEQLKKDGSGWQTRLNETLREALGLEVTK